MRKRDLKLDAACTRMLLSLELRQVDHVPEAHYRGSIPVK
jgi:hypothetical protein